MGLLFMSLFCYFSVCPQERKALFSPSFVQSIYFEQALAGNFHAAAHLPVFACGTMAGFCAPLK